MNRTKVLIVGAVLGLAMALSAHAIETVTVMPNDIQFSKAIETLGNATMPLVAIEAIPDGHGKTAQFTHESNPKLAVFPSGSDGGEGDGAEEIVAIMQSMHPNQRLNL